MGDVDDGSENNELSNNAPQSEMKEEVVINEVLCFIQNHIKRTTKDKIVECIGKCCSPEALLEVRDVIRADNRVIKLKTQRLKSEQTAEDLVTAIIDLERCVQIIFVAMNILALPKCDPKDIEPFANLQRIICLEQKLKLLEESMMKPTCAGALQIEGQRVYTSKSYADIAGIPEERDKAGAGASSEGVSTLFNIFNRLESNV